MDSNFVSICIGVALGVTLTMAIRGTHGRRRVRLALAVGASSIVLMTIWALWRGSFPATFGPFTFVSMIGSLTARQQTSDGV